MAKKVVERSFKYQKRTAEDIKARANMKGGNFDTYIKPKFKQWKPKDGKNIIRILPATWNLEDTPWQETKHYGLDIYVNFNIGPDNQSYLSLSRHAKGDDPLAEAKREAQREGDKDLAKALNANQRILYWIIDRNNEDDGPLLWAAPFTFDKSLNNLCIDEDTKEVLYIDGEEDGNDVRFYKEGTGLTTKYDPSKMKVLAVSSIHEDEGQQQDWLDYITDNPLSDVLNFYEYDHIKASFDGQAGRKDDDEDEKPVRSRKAKDDEDDDKPASRRRSRVEDEDEKPARRAKAKASRDDNDDEDEEDEVPKGRSTNGSKRSAPVDDDEVDEKPTRRTRAKVADDDDEDEDESPPPKSRRGKTDDEDEGGGSIRERLAARRRSRNAE